MVEALTSNRSIRRSTNGCESGTYGTVLVSSTSRMRRFEPHQPARPHKQRADAGDDAIANPEPGRTRPGAIEDQQLLLETQRFGHHGMYPACTVEPDDGRHEMKKQDGQIAHGAIVINRAKSPRC